MTSPHIAKLASLTRCPCCGADATARDIDPRGLYASAAFACTGAFALSQGTIIASVICPASAHLAARLMNIEADGKAGEQRR